MRGLAEHLAAAHDVDVRAVSTLDAGVFRVELGEATWVARVFGPERPRSAVEQDAAVLRRLEQAGFPAERLTGDVTAWDDRHVLVTGLVEGVRARPTGRTWAWLGALLGRLHTHDGAGLGPGGAWHHLSPVGGPRAEIDAAIALLDALPGTDRLLHELEASDDTEGLPAALVHPDLVPVNAIATPDERYAIVDWTGAGCGPRVWSLAFPLWAAGRQDLRLVDAFVKRYARHTTLTADELDAVEGAVRARPLLLDSWGVGQGRPAHRAQAGLAPSRTLAVRVAERVRAVCDAARDGGEQPGGH